MTETQKPKKYDLEERTYKFAADCRRSVKNAKYPSLELDDSRQLIRSSGSVAANYIEANEALSRKDFILRIKICRKEAKESILWLKLLDSNSDPEVKRLLQEASELMKIFGAILKKSE